MDEHRVQDCTSVDADDVEDINELRCQINNVPVVLEIILLLGDELLELKVEETSPEKCSDT